MRLSRPDTLLQLSLLALFTAQSCAASVIAPINGQQATMSLRPAALNLESSLDIHQSKNGLNSEEFRKFGSMISDISEDEGDSPKSVAPAILKGTPKLSVARIEMNSFVGPNVEFHWKPDNQGAKKVTMCGSWTGWKDHYTLTLNADTGLYETLVDNIPEGEHQFKFIVDDLWFCNEAYTISKDEDGNANNVMRITSKSTDTSVSGPPAKSSAGQAASAVTERRQNEKPLILRILLKILFFWRK